MRVVVALHHHFRRLPDGAVYPYSVFDYTFWRRYLDVFDEVVVFARVRRVEKIESACLPGKANGPRVGFYALPDFLGAWQFLECYTRITALSKRVLQKDDACILRIPSFITMPLWHHLRRTKRPYGVEVVGDIWQALAPGSHQSKLRGILRLKWPKDTARQCHYAAVAAYVTETVLQQRYSSKGWSTNYSSVELPYDVILDESALKERIRRIETKAKSGGPWRLCFVGSLWHLCKAPDVLIDAVADCVKNGLNVELTVIGGGCLMERLQEQARQRGVAEQVEFLGQLPPGQAIYEQLDRADIYVLPSHSEGLPRSIIEAFARGLPCIGGSEGGFNELLEPEYMVKPISVAALSGTIRRAISDTDGLKRTTRENLLKAQKYRSDLLQQRRVECYSRLRDTTEAWAEAQK
jgi:glycosyltransferase involved in cell wall biosynthesis